MNPLDQGLLFASRFFPLDIILLGIVIGFFFIFVLNINFPFLFLFIYYLLFIFTTTPTGYMIGVTMFAISSAGIKIFILSLYRVAVRATCPQGMVRRGKGGERKKKKMRKAESKRILSNFFFCSCGWCCIYHLLSQL